LGYFSPSDQHAVIRADLSQYFPLKAAFEEILGRATYSKLKDYGSIGDWRRESVRLLTALDLAISASVQVADDAWRSDIAAEIQHGIGHVRKATEIDELFAALSSALARVAFLQVGLIPRGHRNLERVSLVPAHWRLDSFRSAQYVQSSAQRDAQERAGLQ
jgi:hypothetical protein